MNHKHSKNSSLRLKKGRDVDNDVNIDAMNDDDNVDDNDNNDNDDVNDDDNDDNNDNDDVDTDATMLRCSTFIQAIN